MKNLLVTHIKNYLTVFKKVMSVSLEDDIVRSTDS